LLLWSVSIFFFFCIKGGVDEDESNGFWVVLCRFDLTPRLFFQVLEVTPQSFSWGGTPDEENQPYDDEKEEYHPTQSLLRSRAIGQEKQPGRKQISRPVAAGRNHHMHACMGRTWMQGRFNSAAQPNTVPWTVSVSTSDAALRCWTQKSAG
jgi:hypothetical protein